MAKKTIPQRKRARNDLTAEYVRSILSYNPKTGNFIWRVNRPPRGKRGRIAGARKPDGYITINIDGIAYYAHRLAWLVMTGKWPEHQIDHEGMNTSDNRWHKIRHATHAQNLQNRPAPKNSKSGIKGVHRRTDCNRWSAFIQKNKKKFYLGLFETAEEAETAYAKAAKKLHQEFAHL